MWAQAAAWALPGSHVALTATRRQVVAGALAAAARDGVLLRLPAAATSAAVASAVAEAGGVSVGDEDAPEPSGGGRWALAGQAPLIVLSTSGSTGVARAVVKSADQLFGEARAHAAALQIGEDDHIVATVPAQHIYGLLFSVCLPLVSGASVTDGAPFFPADVIEALRGATVLVTVPAHLRVLADLEPGALPALRYVLSSGAPLPPDTAQRLWARHGWRVTEVFGSTETGGVASRVSLDGPTWRPLPGVWVGAAEDGGLLIDAPWLAQDAPRPWTADDRVRLVDGGFVHEGRLDDVVKVASKRVSVGALTTALFAVDGVRDAAVLVANDGDVTTLFGLVAGDEGVAERARASLREAFDPAVVPRLFSLASLPRAGAGKLPREALLLATQRASFQARLRRSPEAAVVEIASDHPGFHGHFPDQPVLPGAVLLGAVVAPHIGPIVGVDVLTFHRPVLPGARLTLLWSREGAEVTIEVMREMTVLVSGRVRVAPQR